MTMKKRMNHVMEKEMADATEAVVFSVKSQWTMK